MSIRTAMLYFHKACKAHQLACVTTQMALVMYIHPYINCSQLQISHYDIFFFYQIL